MNTKMLEGYDKYILFGAYVMGKQALKQFREAGIEIAYFCDNEESKWNTLVDDVKVVPPGDLADIVKNENALVVICSSYAKHLISIQLDELDVPYVYFSKPIFVEITSFCNQTCTFCPYEHIERKKESLCPDIMKAFLHDLGSANSDVLFPAIYPHVLGEPLVSKHFFDFMDTCKELGFYVCIVTNWALMNEETQRRLFTEYPDLDIILSMQGATERVFNKRGENQLTYDNWVDLLFEIMESKFKYAHKGLIQISTTYPDVANDVLIRSETRMHVFEWYENADEFKQWKRGFGSRCVAFNSDMQKKYPENYEKIKDAKSPIEYYYHKYWPISDFEEWINANGPSQFEFAPNIHIYEKKFGIWGVEKFLKSLLPDDKYLYWEENWHALTEKCDRVGDVALLSSGQLVSCNIDNEADNVFADYNIGEKYTDDVAKNRYRTLRDNLSSSDICRRCKARAMVFDTSDILGGSQDVIHYGVRWHGSRANESGEKYRISYELSNAYVFPRIDAKTLEIDIASVQDKKQFTLVRILSYDDENKIFTECKNYSEQIKTGERKTISIPYSFTRSKMYRIDFITATQRDEGVDNGVAVYAISLKEE